MPVRSMALIAGLLLASLGGCVDSGEGSPHGVQVTTPEAPAPEEPTESPSPAPSTTSPPPAPSPSPASNATPEPPAGTPPDAPAIPPVVVAVIDSGIRPDHEAFNGTPIVAWHDFGKGGSSTVPTELWDPDSEPYDEDGHGTAVASMVAGRGAHTPSHAPAVQLAIAKTATRDEGHYWRDVENAIRWATDVVGADVITMSVYSYQVVLAPGGTVGGLDAIERARGKGVLPVMLAGNGLQNAGIPTMSWMHPPASSPHALVVGGAYDDGSPIAPLGSMDPEVTAVYTVRAACTSSPSCYREMGGTSFSTPLVAGMAARLVEVAREKGLEDPGPDRLEALLKNAAHDAAVHPPNLEGYGFLDADALAMAAEHLVAGTTPERDEVGQASALYVETVQQTAREAWTAL